LTFKSETYFTASLRFYLTTHISHYTIYTLKLLFLYIIQYLKGRKRKGLKPKSVLDQRPKLYSLQEDKESWKEKNYLFGYAI